MFRKLQALTFMVLISLGQLLPLKDEPIPSDKFTFDEQLLTKVIYMEHEMELMKKSMQQNQDILTSTLKNLTAEIENKTAELELIGEKVSNPMVAFNAYGVVDQSLETSQILILQHTYINEGNGYDTVLGLFTAPVGGLYMFAVNACTYSTASFYFYIVVDGNVIAKSTKYNGKQDDCAATTTLTKVQTGQRVWVKSASGSSSTAYLYEYTYQQTTFSGVLLHG